MHGVGEFRSWYKVGYKDTEDGGGIDYVPVLNKADMELRAGIIRVFIPAVEVMVVMVVQLRVSGDVQTEDTFADVWHNRVAQGCNAY